MDIKRRFPHKPVTLEEVALQARVSASTVSRVLNDLTVVKNSTRTRVLKAAKELGYHPDLRARTLARGINRTIGVVVSNLENPFFFDIYKVVEAGAHANGYEVVIANTNYQSGQLVNSIRTMIGRRVAGLAIVVSEVDSTLMESLAEGPIPVVFYDVGTPGLRITNIRVDYARGVTTLFQYLCGLGHSRFGFLGHHAALNPINTRMRAVIEAVQARAPEFQVHTALGEDDLEGGRQAVRDLLAIGFDPTAVICVNDIMAVGALRELRERGYEVPGRISVTGFDNIALSEFCSPPLTTVHIPRDRIGRIICECLMPDPQKNSPRGNEIIIDPQLVVRESTGPVATNR
jgi:LacI family transcriptional regulator